jgi:hypothetical protein
LLSEEQESTLRQAVKNRSTDITHFANRRITQHNSSVERRQRARTEPLNSTSVTDEFDKTSLIGSESLSFQECPTGLLEYHTVGVTIALSDLFSIVVIR